jgi:hypothetical protein
VLVVRDAAGLVVDVLLGFVVVVVLEAFAPVVLVVELLVLAVELPFGFVEVVVLLEAFALEPVVLVVELLLAAFLDVIVVVVLLATVAAPAFRVVVVVGLAFLGSGTVQVRREEPS